MGGFLKTFANNREMQDSVVRRVNCPQSAVNRIKRPQLRVQCEMEFIINDLDHLEVQKWVEF
jgi:hypothetical protein